MRDIRRARLYKQQSRRPYDTPTALLYVLAGYQYRISKIKFAISVIAVTPATASTKASLASW